MNRALLYLFLVVGSLLAPTAWGASSSSESTEPLPAEAKATETARRHFDRGARLYKQARYREAIAAFEAAYKARPHGVILFNIAQCHEKLGDLAAAWKSYDAYLKAIPNADDRETVTIAMQNLQKRLAEKGVLAKDTHGSTVRFSPPLVITNEQLLHGVAQLRAVLDDLRG